LLCIILFFSCNNKIQNTETWLSYGPGKLDTNQSISLLDLENRMKLKKSELLLDFKGKLTEVCSKAGCWITIKKTDGSDLRIIFKDHFTIPPKTKIGTDVFIHGLVYWDSIPLDLLKHYAEDAGKSEKEIAKINQSPFELNVEADAIGFFKK